MMLGLLLSGCGSDRVVTLEELGVYAAGQGEEAEMVAPDGIGAETIVSMSVEAGSSEAAGADSKSTETVGSDAKCTEAEAAQQNHILVFVCGAVEKPGVVELSEGKRAVDALQLAGGFREDADESFVNLAGFLSDGQRLYFPSKEEVEALESSGELLFQEVGEGIASQKEESTKEMSVNINTADEALLQTLPGIGASRARAIVEYRQEMGAFSTPSDITKVSGIGDSMYQQIKDLIRVK